jgi:hypothetical protein
MMGAYKATLTAFDGIVKKLKSVDERSFPSSSRTLVPCPSISGTPAPSALSHYRCLPLSHSLSPFGTFFRFPSSLNSINLRDGRTTSVPFKRLNWRSSKQSHPLSRQPLAPPASAQLCALNTRISRIMPRLRYLPPKAGRFLLEYGMIGKQSCLNGLRRLLKRPLIAILRPRTTSA